MKLTLSFPCLKPLASSYILSKFSARPHTADPVLLDVPSHQPRLTLPVQLPSCLWNSAVICIYIFIWCWGFGALHTDSFVVVTLRKDCTSSQAGLELARSPRQAWNLQSSCPTLARNQDYRPVPPGQTPFKKKQNKTKKTLICLEFLKPVLRASVLPAEIARWSLCYLFFCFWDILCIPGWPRTMWTRLALNLLWSACFWLPSARMMGMDHHAQLTEFTEWEERPHKKGQKKGNQVFRRDSAFASGSVARWTDITSSCPEGPQDETGWLFKQGLPLQSG